MRQIPVLGTVPAPDLLHAAVLDGNLRPIALSDGFEVVFSRWPELATGRGTLSAPVRAFIREQVTAYRERGESETTALLRPELIVHVCELGSDKDRCIAVTFATFHQRHPLRLATRTFNLTRRESQVLVLLLRGMSAAEIAAALELSEMTIGDYFKRLRAKTGARTQSGMIATLMGWRRDRGSLGVVDSEDAR